MTNVVFPSKIIGVGLNYRAHAGEMNKKLPEQPLLFMKPPSALIAHEQTIILPVGYDRIDYEGELGVVIGRQARHVAAQHALDYVRGYTCVNDVTVRDLQKKDVQYTRAKGFDTFCPAGPRVVEGLDPNRLAICSRVNGETRQDSNTADMIFNVASLIEFITAVMTLEEGDVITTGTPPGVGPLAPGDIVEVEIEHIGVLRNSVASAEKQEVLS